MVINILHVAENRSYIGLYRHNPPAFTHPQDLLEIKLKYRIAGEPDVLHIAQ